jgi:hypothetical protein
MMTGGKKAFALVAVTIMIVIIAVAIFGITAVVTNTQRLGADRFKSQKALHAAQAGVYDFIYQYYYTSRLQQRFKSRDTEVAPGSGVYFDHGVDANLLLVNARDAAINADRLTIPHVKNLDYANPINITRFSLTYNFNAHITQLYIYRTIWSGFAVSDELIQLAAPYQLTFDAAIEMVFIFDNLIPPDADITLTLYFSDGSSRKALLWRNAKGGDYSFSITSTGKVGSGNADWKRTIEATWDWGTRMISSWQEVDRHVQ